MDAALRRLSIKADVPAGAVTSLVCPNGNRQRVQHLLSDNKDVKAVRVTLPNRHRAYVVKDPSGAPIFAGITPSIVATRDALLRAGSVPQGWVFSVATASDFSNVCFKLTMRDCIRKHNSTGLAVQPPDTTPSIVKRACLYEIIKEGQRRFIGVTRDLAREKQLLPSPEMKFRRIRYVSGTCDEQSLQDTLTHTIAASIRAGDRLSPPPYQWIKPCAFEILDAKGQRVRTATALSLVHAVHSSVKDGHLPEDHKLRKLHSIAADDHMPVNKFGDLVRQRLLKSNGLVFHVFNAEGFRVFSGFTGKCRTSTLFVGLGLLYSDKLTFTVPKPDEDGVPTETPARKRLLRNMRRLKKQKVRCIFELTGYLGNRAYVGAAASVQNAMRNKTVVELLKAGFELRKVRDVPSGSLCKAKAAYIKKSIAEGHSLQNTGVCSAPFLYEVVDKWGQRIYVGVSFNFQATRDALRSRGILSPGRVLLKARDIPKDMSVTKAEKRLIVDSLQSGDPLQNNLNFVPHLDPSIYTKKDESARGWWGKTASCEVVAKTTDFATDFATDFEQVAPPGIDENCVFEIRNLLGQFVYVGAAPSRKAVMEHSTVRKLTARGCTVRMLHAVPEGEEALLAAKENYAALNAKLITRSPQGRLRATTPIASALRKDSVPSVLMPAPTPNPSKGPAAGKRAPGQPHPSLCLVPKAGPVTIDILRKSYSAAFQRQIKSAAHIEKFLSLHSKIIQKNRRGHTPSLSDRGVIYALFDESFTVAYVGQTMHTPGQRARDHVQAALTAWRKTSCLKKMTRIHAATLRNGAPFYVAPVEKVSGYWSCKQTFRRLATEREKHFIKVLKPRYNTTYMNLTRT